MVSPPEPQEEPGLRRPARWAVIGAVGVIVAGAVGIGRLTTPQAAPETSTTLPLEVPTTPTTAPPFHVSQIEQGEPIEWVRALDLEGETVIAVEHRHGLFYLFATESYRYPDYQSRGLSVRSSSDGLAWNQVGAIGPEFHPGGVVANRHGFFAYGTGQDGNPVVWRSGDGIKWDPTELPDERRPGTHNYVQAALATDDLILLVGDVYVDEAQAMLDRALGDSFPGLRAYLYQRSPAQSEWTVELIGPLGIPLLSLTLEEVGLTPAEIEAATGSSQLVSWVGSPEGGSWRRVDLADRWEPGEFLFYELQALISGPDGRIWTKGYGMQGWRTFATGDGVTWEQLDIVLPANFDTGGDGYLSVRPDGGIPTLWVSADLESWESLETDRFLPRGLDWGSYYLPNLAGGEAGVAMTVRSYHTRDLPPHTVGLERDGYTLEVGYPSTLLRDGIELSDSIQWGITAPRFTRLSADGDAVVFFDPETGEDLVSFTLDELRAAEEAIEMRYRPPDVTRDHHVVIFSPDRDQWTVQSLAGIVGEDESILRLAVGDELIIMVTQDDRPIRGSTVWVGIPPG